MNTGIRPGGPSRRSTRMRLRIRAALRRSIIAFGVHGEGNTRRQLCIAAHDEGINAIYKHLRESSQTEPCATGQYTPVRRGS
ncbi:hypothetical protein C2E23DRAFT_344554 [Lenzites betulinus]|nr:hypothetical protein C2E23DRAFT_344554 [Lenzites betulinus]